MFACGRDYVMMLFILDSVGLSCHCHCHWYLFVVQQEVEDAANILLMVAPAMLKQAEEQAAKMPSIPPPVITSPHPNLDLLDTLAALAAQKSPMHRKRIAWNDDMVVSKRSEEHTSELQSLMRISYAVFCLKKKNNT